MINNPAVPDEEASGWAARAVAAFNAALQAGEPSYALLEEAKGFYRRLAPHAAALVAAGLDLEAFKAPGVLSGAISREYPEDTPQED